MAKKGKKGSGKKKAQKATSNVFALFSQTQIQEFKEAFNMIDQDRNGFITKEDLAGMFSSMGKDPPGDYLDEMIKEATGDINFTMFLTLFGEKLHGTDPEDVIKNAFKCFDPDGNKVIPGEELKRLLMTMGERFTKEEVDEMFAEQDVDENGNFDYIEFTRLVKHGPKQDEEA
jgi:Ca2+-binding EF-hand superfamily protein